MPLKLRIESELDERSASASMDRAQRIYAQGAQDISRQMREQITDGARQGGRAIEQMADNARAAYARVGDATDELRTQERQLQQMRADGARGVEVQAEVVRRARKAEKDAIREAADEYERYERAARGAGQAGEQAGASILSGLRTAVAGGGQAGDDMASEFMGGFAGSSALLRLGAAGGPVGLAIAGIGALGYAGGKVLGDQISAGLESSKMRDTFRAKLGVDESTMSGYGDAAGRAFVNQFGSSVEDNLRATEFGIKSGLIDRNATDAEVQNLIQQIQTVSGVIGEDTARVAQGARNLIKTGMVDSYQEAFDLLTTASQQGLDISGDLLDTAEEYGTAWQSVGLTGADAMGLIDQMWQAGIRNTDVAADSIKELTINLTDGSKLTADTLAALGLNAEDMMNRFAQGGPVARDAFGEVLTALQAIDDPVQKNLIGLNLFKTKWEDAKTAIDNADLSTAASELGDIDGATRDAAAAVGEHANQWDTLGRNIDQTFDKFQRWLADSAIGKFFSQDLPTFLNLPFQQGPPAVDNTGLPVDSQVPRNPNPLPPGASDPGSLLIPGGPGSAPRAPGGTGNPLTDIFGLQPGAPAGPPPPQRTTPVPLQPGSAGGAASTSLPDAPVLPMSYTSTAGLPSSIANAVTRVDEARHDVAEKQARVDQLEQSNIATAEDIQKAKNDLTKAGQQQLQADRALQDAKQRETEQAIKANERAAKQLEKQGNSIADFGAKLDDDFGASKGLAGLAENLTKFFMNLAFAPAFGQLMAQREASGFDPSKDGRGLIGMMLGGRGSGSSGTSSILSGSRTGASGGGYPGDAALLANVPAGRYTQEQRGDLTQGLADCSSAVEDLVNLMDGRPTAGASMATGNADQWLTERGFLPGMGGPGDFRVGFNEGHMQATLPGGTPFNWGSDSAAANRGIGGSGADDPSFTSHYYRPMGGDGAYAPVGVTAGGGALPSSGGATPVFVVNMPGGGGFPGAGGPPPGSPASGSGAGPLPGPGGSGGLSTEQWNNIMGAEAGGSGGWGANTGNGFYGGLQFKQSTWDQFKLPGMPDRADLATAEQQMQVGNRVYAAQGAGAWPATSAAHPDWFTPSAGGGPGGGVGGSGGPGGTGGTLPPLPTSLPGGAGGGESGLLGLLGAGGPAAPSQSVMGGRAWGTGLPASGGISFGGGLIGAAAGAAGGAASMGMGGGAAADIAMQLGGRAIGAIGQYAGNAVSGLLETFSLSDSALADPSSSWAGRLLGAAAGIKPALPNSAGALGGEQNKNMAEGGKKALTPQQAQDAKAGAAAGQAAGGNVDQSTNVTINNPQARDVDGSMRDVQSSLGATQTAAQTATR